jgi:hypothetical protein
MEPKIDRNEYEKANENTVIRNQVLENIRMQLSPNNSRLLYLS